MNTSQIIVITMVTAVIFVTIAMGMQYADKLQPQELTYYLLATIVLLVWFFFVFISDLYMKIKELSKRVEKYQEQFHKDIMKRYIEIDEKCGKKLP